MPDKNGIFDIFWGLSQGKVCISLLSNSWPFHDVEHSEQLVLWLIRTCLWMKTTEPRSLQVPPCLSTWSMRRIWRKRIPRMAEVANTWPLEPTERTTIDAETTMRSERKGTRLSTKFIKEERDEQEEEKEGNIVVRGKKKEEKRRKGIGGKE